MAPLIRFKLIEIDSKVTFNGKKKKDLKYPVRSVSLVPVTYIPANITGLSALPEIFWQ